MRRTLRKLKGMRWTWRKYHPLKCRRSAPSQRKALMKSEGSQRSIRLSPKKNSQWRRGWNIIRISISNHDADVTVPWQDVLGEKVVGCLRGKTNNKSPNLVQKINWINGGKIIINYLSCSSVFLQLQWWTIEGLWGIAPLAPFLS